MPPPWKLVKGLGSSIVHWDNQTYTRIMVLHGEVQVPSLPLIERTPPVGEFNVSIVNIPHCASEVDPSEKNG